MPKKNVATNDQASQTPKREVSKKRPGRPRKPANQKTEQFSIRLSPTLKVGLELIARDRQVSLSQAIETVLATYLRGYTIDDQSALKLAASAVAAEEGRVDLFKRDSAGEIVTYDDANKRAQHNSLMERSQLIRIYTFPARLRTKKEQFLLDVAQETGAFEEIAEDSSDEYVTVNVRASLIPHVIRISEDGFRTGLTVKEAAKQVAEAAKTP